MENLAEDYEQYPRDEQLARWLTICVTVQDPESLLDVLEFAGYGWCDECGGYGALLVTGQLQRDWRCALGWLRLRRRLCGVDADASRAPS